ncbi:putative HTH-type transcriptional regulator YdfH [Vibrio aerogenes CECT 7868]|uniref:Putative HTH-type transcriptional regulator YdfH n=1 Tax=Vibrio aerogenes CECT 7868 TaxID=1216006 RepID=A0A1M5ZJV7_9VIBR|nr:GntR family transcriptional regulator [Vibrio aerogenes]SHI24520.1 putative HTH-type transcriptional regulator YdfH [Vibrio aerogenes CECT 7868]
MMNFKPINLLPARERVAAELRKAILSSQYQEGDILTLDQVSKLLGVSVTPVREAFQLLNSDGLIKLRPNKGAIVLGVNEQYIKEHFELRLILESEMIKKLCDNQDADISEICNIYEKSKEEVEQGIFDNYSNLNQAFHMAIWQAADNSRIFSILSSLWNGLSMENNTTEKDYAMKSLNEHKDIINALKARDSQHAYQLMREHILRSEKDMLTHIRPD